MKKSYILIVLALVAMVATGCNREEIRAFHSFRITESGFNDPETKMHFTLANGGNSGAYSKLCYDNGDKVLVNGHSFTLSNTSGSVWMANADDGNPVEATRFYCIYANPGMSIAGADNLYNFTSSFNGQCVTHNGVILVGSTDDALLTLNPACAILRFPAGAQMDYVRVGFSPNKIVKSGSISISSDGNATITPSDYLTGVTSDVTGNFLEMVNDGTDGYASYYVAVPIAGPSVTTQLFFTWKYYGIEDVYKYKTTSTVTLQRGKVYTVGSTRVSPFDENGATKKLFKVGASTYVYFSCGNLQCQNAPTRVWRFAEHQYDIIAGNNVLNDLTYEGWVDLFGWGTSGWNSGAVARYPYSLNTDNADYWPGGSSSNNLRGTYAQADWGVRNSDGTRHIYYGSNANTGAWRTLSSDEWSYLLTGRANAASKWGYATIDGTHKGVVILPESFTTPAGVTFNSGKSSQFSTNEYSLDEWGAMEYAGAIFLPTTGYRDGTTMYALNVGSEEGRYWSTSYANENNAYSYRFTKSLHQPTNSNARHFGYAVRLVKDYVDPDDDK